MDKAPEDMATAKEENLILRFDEIREFRRSGRKTLKKHYGLLLILIMIGILLGAEFSEEALFMHITENRSLLPTVQPMGISDHFEDPGAEVLADILSGNVVEGIDLSDQLEEQFSTSGGSVLGHTQGVLAALVNTVTSGHLYVKVLQSIFTITKSPEVSLIIFVILAILIFTLVFVGIRDPYRVMMRRMFLEARTYDKVPFYHIFHLKHAQRWVRASLCIVAMDFFYFLWFLTIAGAVIKRYSYYLVPFIVAENPDIRPMEALTLSRRMMDGHKIECFKLELTFIGWLALGFLTGGFLNIFLYGPYKMASVSEYYAYVRKLAIENSIPGTEMLDDTYLYEHAEEYRLRSIYKDIEKEQEYLDEHPFVLTGVKKFFAENLGMWVGSLEGKEEYQNHQNREYHLSGAVDVIHGLAYPDRLDPRYRSEALVHRVQTSFIRCYTAWNLALMFFLFAFIGWIWEVILFVIQTGEFVNRGTLYGPWIPIYGFGGTMILVVVCKLRTEPVLEFLSIALVSDAVEYFTSYFLEKSTGMRWWDYSGYFLNLDGRICAEGLFAFAALGSMVVYFLAPLLDSWFMRINHKVLRTITVVLIAAFCTDVVYAHFHPHTGKGITDMGALDFSAGLPPDDAGLPKEFHR